MNERQDRITAGRAAVVAMVLLTAASAGAAETLVRNVAEFDAAVKAAAPGDAIVLADGEWRDVDLVFRGEGKATSEQRIVLKGQTPGKVVLTGGSRLRIGGRHLVVRDLLWRDSTAAGDVVSFRIDSKTPASDCLLSACAMLGDAPDRERKWVSLYGTKNSVADCRFEEKRSRGTLLVVWLAGEPADHWITRNYFGPRSALGKNGGEIVRIGDSKTSMNVGKTSLVGNVFHRCGGEAEIISNKSCENEYSANLFVGCGGALTLRHGNDCLVYRNLFFGDGQKGTGGVRIIGEGHTVAHNLFHELTGDSARAALSLMNGLPNSPLNGYFRVRGAKIEHNRFVNCKQSILIGSSDEDQKQQTLPPVDCELRDNTVVADRPILAVRTEPMNLTAVDNRYRGELGRDDAAGWTVDPQLNAELSDEVRELVRTMFRVGPEWMPAGEEAWPAALKAKSGP